MTQELNPQTVRQHHVDLDGHRPGGDNQDPSLLDDEAEVQGSPDPDDGITLVDARYEYTMWGDDRWLIAAYVRPNGVHERCGEPYDFCGCFMP